MANHTSARVVGLLLWLGWQPVQGQVPWADRVREAASQLEAIELRYLKEPLMEREHAVTARISDGQLFHLTHDYERAAIVFLDVVGRRNIEAHPGYPDAAYYLADSLFHLRNFRAAANWYEVVSQRGTPQQRQEALGRLIEIAVATGEEPQAQALLQRAEAVLRANPVPPLLYAVGKLHFRRSELDAARDAFTRIPTEDALWYRAQYFLGVTEVKARRLPEALATFTELVRRGEQAQGLESDQRTALDEARLAVGRIHYERGELEAAVQAYAAVPRDSAAFDDALFESVWISIKQGEFENALRKLEIQLIAQPDVLQGPDARLLQGKLLLMLGHFEESSRAFQEVLFEFEPIQAEMRGVARGGDLVEHFNQVIGRGIAEFDLTTFLPARAAEFAGSDAEADRALRLVADLGAQRRDLEEIDRTIRRLEAAIKAPSRMERRPKLREGWLKAAELRAQMMDAKAGLLDELAGIRDPELLAVRKVRQEAGRRFAAVPRSSTAMLARRGDVDQQLQALDRNLFELDLQIRAVEAQLAAVVRYVEDRTRIDGHSPRDPATLRQVEAEKGSALALRGELRRLVDDLAIRRLQIGVGDEASTQDELLRAAYERALDAEAEALRARGMAVPADVLAQARAVEARARRFQKAAEGLVQEWVDDTQKVLDDERGRLGGYQTELAAQQHEAENLGGLIAARSFLHVLNRIHALVLEADVGLIDVAWKQKQDQSDQITRLLDRQAADLKALDQVWREVRGD